MLANNEHQIQKISVSYNRTVSFNQSSCSSSGSRFWKVCKFKFCSLITLAASKRSTGFWNDVDVSVHAAFGFCVIKLDLSCSSSTWNSQIIHMRSMALTRSSWKWEIGWFFTETPTSNWLIWSLILSSVTFISRSVFTNWICSLTISLKLCDGRFIFVDILLYVRTQFYQIQSNLTLFWHLVAVKRSVWLRFEWCVWRLITCGARKENQSVAGVRRCLRSIFMINEQFHSHIFNKNNKQWIVTLTQSWHKYYFQLIIGKVLIECVFLSHLFANDANCKMQVAASFDKCHFCRLFGNARNGCTCAKYLLDTLWLCENQ